MFKVYAGYYELFVSTSTLSSPFMWQGEFDTIEEAEDFLDENFDTENDSVYYERPIFTKSRAYAEFLTEEEQEDFLFDVTADGLILQATNEWKQQQGII